MSEDGAAPINEAALLGRPVKDQDMRVSDTGVSGKSGGLTSAMWRTLVSGANRRMRGFLLAVLVPAAINFSPSPIVRDVVAEPAVTLQLGTSQAEIGDRIPLRIVVEGKNDFSEPILPPVSGLEIVFQGRAQSVQIVNMQVNSSKIFNYIIIPQQVGDYTLGPAHVEYAGASVTSNSASLKVAASNGTRPASKKERGVLIEASVDNDKPYLGQQVTLLFRFARTAGARIRNAGYELPDLSSFWSEGVESRREYAQNINGLDYLVTEIAIPLFPVKEGELTIGPVVLRYDEVVASRSEPQSSSFQDPFGRSVFDDDFFKMFRSENIVKRTAQTGPITVHVRPIPSQDRPEEYGGGVGKFSMMARLSSDQVKVGESITLTLSLSGEGNIRDLADPKVEMKDVKIYSDNPAVTVKNYHEKIVGEKVYKFALVPQQAGRLQIPEIAIPYYNPESERFEFASSTMLEVEVLPAEKETLVLKKADGSGKSPAASALDDLLPIHERIGQMQSSQLGVWLRRIRPLAYPLPILVYAFCFVYARRRERLRTDVAYRRLKFASRTAEAYLADAEDSFNRKDFKTVFSKTAKAVSEYIAAKLNIASAGLTPVEIEELLTARGAQPEVVSELREFLDFCDYGRFTSSRKSSNAARDCMARARRLLERLEDEEGIGR
ncbi:MAG: protein BatD [Candidatus Abyssobacteria bacterium SURF_5]|uniref:Protein BatD n=1 Tax=Abyssobacteria bacterium (strain SURF_5) TaxID=2093360 RepID=A0A3A4NZC4_ABYX5|nr:MAG: protein BatD [Candidatus Abyssubacteria bacterium SURF_5]